MHNTRIVSSEVYMHSALVHPVPSLQLVWQCHTHQYRKHFWLVSPDSGTGSWQLSLWTLYTRLSPPNFMEERACLGLRPYSLYNHSKIGMGQNITDVLVKLSDWAEETELICSPSTNSTTLKEHTLPTLARDGFKHSRISVVCWNNGKQVSPLISLTRCDLKAVETNVFSTVKALQTNKNVAKCCYCTLEAPPTSFNSHCMYQQTTTALKAPTEKAAEWLCIMSYKIIVHASL